MNNFDNLFNRFDEIEHAPLRAFNRAVLLYNIMEDYGQVPADRYRQQFTEQEAKQMYLILVMIRDNGEQYVREIVTKGMAFSDMDNDEEMEKYVSIQ